MHTTEDIYNYCKALAEGAEGETLAIFQRFEEKELPHTSANILNLAFILQYSVINRYYEMLNEMKSANDSDVNQITVVSGSRTIH